MAKLYIFGIGGTGSRVIKALTMLLASGVKLNKNISKVIPIIIDPDVANGDMNRSLKILKLYQDIRAEIHEPDQFFHTNIESLSHLTSPQAHTSLDHFKMQLEGVEKSKFKEFIGMHKMSEANSAFSNLLFSERNQEADMEVGFKGNPNMGSVVLNQLIDNEEFEDFAQSFSADDKIFIISSIFGGTGAAGFPLLLKNLRSGNPTISNSGAIKNATIGAISVLPYFNVELDRESQIDSDSFLEKARAAMHYYDRTIIRPKAINALYYIGDSPQKTYANNEGSISQQNDAHFIELASAYAIVDFSNEADVLKTNDGQASNFTFKEFGVEQYQNKLNFSCLDSPFLDTISRELSQFKLCANFLNHGLDKAVGVVNWSVKDTLTDKTFFSGILYRQLIQTFTEYYNEWLDEMDRNQVGFSPFNLSVKEKDALLFIQGKEPSRKGVFKSDNSFEGMHKEVNNCFHEFKSNGAINQLMKMLEKASLQILKSRKLLN